MSLKVSALTTIKVNLLCIGRAFKRIICVRGMKRPPASSRAEAPGLRPVLKADPKGPGCLPASLSPDMTVPVAPGSRKFQLPISNQQLALNLHYKSLTGLHTAPFHGSERGGRLALLLDIFHLLTTTSNLHNSHRE